jgi:predicted RNA-binding protein YlxR (DUF448 family)
VPPSPRAAIPSPDAQAGPRRTCIGCRAVRSPGDLVRIVRASDGSLAVGRTLPGRGAWLCRGSQVCFEQAAGRGGFARAFRTSIPAVHLDALRSELAGTDQGPTSDFVPGSPAARD